MSDDIYRKKSLDKIQSPDNLNEYIRVVNPGVWMLVIAMIVLLLGALVWGFFGRLDTCVEAVAKAKNGTVVCTVNESDIIKIEEGMTVRITSGDEPEGVVESIDMDDSQVTATIDVKNGRYPAQIVIETVAPIRFITN